MTTPKYNVGTKAGIVEITEVLSDKYLIKYTHNPYLDTYPFKIIDDYVDKTLSPKQLVPYLQVGEVYQVKIQLHGIDPIPYWAKYFGDGKWSMGFCIKDIAEHAFTPDPWMAQHTVTLWDGFNTPPPVEQKKVRIIN